MSVKVTGIPGTYITTKGVIVFPPSGVGYVDQATADEISAMTGFEIVENDLEKLAGTGVSYTPAALALGLVVDDDDDEVTTVQKTGSKSGAKKINVNRVAVPNTED